MLKLFALVLAATGFTSPAAAVLYQKTDGTSAELLCAVWAPPVCDIYDIGGPHPYAGPAPGPGVDLSGADLRGAALQEADLSNAILDGAQFQAANVGDARLDGALANFTNFERVRAVGAEVTDLDLSTAILDLGRFYELVGSPLVLPVGIEAILMSSGATALVGQTLDLEDADLSGGLDLSGYDLSFSNFEGADLRDANLSGADLNSSVLDYADLERADLSGADLRSADLFSATLTDAMLAGSDLTYARLRYAQISGADFSGADLTLAWLVDLAVDAGAEVGLSAIDTLVQTGGTYAIAGPQIDLAYVDFSGLDLTNLNFQGVSFWRANLDRADFGGADLRNASSLPTYGTGLTSAPFYSSATQFAGFDPVFSGWWLTTASSVPALGPFGCGVAVLLLAATGFRRRAA